MLPVAATHETSNIVAELKSGLAVRYVWDEGVVRREAAREIKFRMIDRSAT